MGKEMEMFEQMQETIMNASKVLTEVYPKIAELDRIGFMMILGTMVDQWCGDHNMTSNETFDLMSELCDVQKDVHAQLGVMPKQKGVENGGY